MYVFYNDWAGHSAQKMLKQGFTVANRYHLLSRELNKGPEMKKPTHQSTQIMFKL